ncbi:hypothetical protein LUTEI9C_30301 [Luteimonas sp. 9C]|nr:hypothetical protein LUTEI9C_30301 [Luteimonas sp. 9C]
MESVRAWNGRSCRRRTLRGRAADAGAPVDRLRCGGPRQQAGSAKVAELVDALVLGTSAARRGGSSPPFRTIPAGTGCSAVACAASPVDPERSQRQAWRASALREVRAVACDRVFSRVCPRRWRPRAESAKLVRSVARLSGVGGRQSSEPIPNSQMSCGTVRKRRSGYASFGRIAG